MRRTKILATVGPATDSPAGLRGLLASGTDAFRLNLAHGTDAEHRATLGRMHQAFAHARREGAILADVAGPKIRIGEVRPSPLTLKAGATWTLSRGSRAGDARGASVEISGFGGAARAGDPMMLGDGTVQLTVIRADRRQIVARVLVGGPVASRAGLFLPRARLARTILGPKDRSDVRLAVAGGIDFLGLSFVRGGADVREARRLLDSLPGGRDVAIVAKIERAEALETIDEILIEADGIMVARGDLGIEVPLERLALEQKMLLRRASAAGRFGIVATQMLLSMVHASRPTRAEATDVANAVLDGADAVMLSEESAIGDHPSESVRWLARICESAETALPVRETPATDREALSPDESVAEAAVYLAVRSKAAAIVTPTHSGRTSRLVARLRPHVPILALSTRAPTRRQLSLVWGVRAIAERPESTLDRIGEAALSAGRRWVIGDGPIVVTAGYPVDGRPTNLVRIVDPKLTRRGGRSRSRRR